MCGEYKVVTLCGSTKFKDEFMKAQRDLTLEGNIVISVGFFGHSNDVDIWNQMDEETKIVLMDGFFGKIRREDIDEKLDFFVKYSMEYAKIENENSFLKDILERKIRNYMEYMADKEKFAKILNSDIHFIQSEEMKNEEVEEVAKLTTGQLIKYKACGMHFDLLKLEFSEKNAEIIQEVFSAEEENE